jgi:protocatechuate 3,4-dioxygenase beta subunit
MTSRPSNLSAKLLAGYRKYDRGTQPDYQHPPYASTVKRSPAQPLIVLPTTLSEVTGPIFGFERIRPNDFDLTKQHAGEPIGERIVVTGRLLDGNARAVPHALIEIWQANAAGRYPHPRDQHNAPTDPNFTGAGRTLTDDQGRYRFVTIRPGEYPWRNHFNAWRPAHIHFSIFGPAFANPPRHADVFSGRPAARLRPHVHEHSQRGSTQAHGVDLRLGDDHSRAGTRLQVRHRAARPRRNPDGQLPQDIA